MTLSTASPLARCLLLACLLLVPAAHAQVLLSEDFDGGAVPTGWTSEPTFTGEAWMFGRDTDPTDSGLFFGAEQDHTSGSGFLAFIDDSPFDFGQPALLTPPVNLTGTQGVGLAFWYQNAGPDTNPDGPISVLAVDISVNGGASFETINANRIVITERVENWTEFVVSLVPYQSQSNVVVRFRGIENGNNVNNSDPSLDDVRIEEGLVDGEPPVFVDTHVFEVNSLSDAADETPLDGRCLTAEGECTLRAAIAQANANPNRNIGLGGEVADSVRFGSVPTVAGLAPLLPTQPYLAISEAVVIDGYTAPGYDNSDPTALVNPVVVIDGRRLPGDLNGQVGGLTIGNSGSGTVLRGLVINNVPNDGIIALEVATNLVLQGNYIGVSADGATPQPNTRVGVRINGRSNLVGQRVFANGTVDGRGNLIAASGGEDLGGVGLQLNSDNNEVYGNFIGTNPAGDDLGNEGAGMRLPGGFVSADNNRIGAESAPNTIAYNGGGGIILPGGQSVIGAPGRGNAIRFNRIFANDGIGIDIGRPGVSDGDGVTPNDPGDGDTNLNNRGQNFPELGPASLDGTTLTVGYLVDSAPANSGYPIRVDFYLADTEESGEGALWLGTDVYELADAQAPTTATLAVPSALPAGSFLVATATDEGGNTSEFSAPVAVVASGAAVAVTLTPLDAPVTIPASGGAFQFQATLTNTSAQTQTVQAWSGAVRPDGSVVGPLVGPVTVTIAAGATRGPFTFTQNVPGRAPAGTYSYVARIGSFPNGVLDSDSFPVMKQAQAPEVASSEAVSDWLVVDAATGLPAETAFAEAARSAEGLPETFALEAAYPNPTQGTAEIGFALPMAAEVRLVVYDVLGREVAVLVDDAVEAGRHTVRFDGSGLPSGAYLVRFVGGGFSATQSVTLVR